MEEIIFHNERRKLKDLIPYEQNPRDHTDKEYNDVLTSLRKFGLAEVPVINTDDVIAAGHLRRKAMIELWGEDTEIDVRVPNRKLNDDEFREYLIRSNKNTGHWAMEKVNSWFKEDDLKEWGWEPWELGNKKRPSKTDPDDIPEIPHNPYGVKEGEIWILGEHRLMCGDSSKAEHMDRLMSGKKADMVFTDPPYGFAYVGKTKNKLTIQSDNVDETKLSEYVSAWFNNTQKASKPGAYWLATVPAGPLHEVFLSDWKRRGILRQDMVWVKDTLVMGRSEYHYKHEPILFGWISGGTRLKNNDRTKTTVWEFDRPKASREHPTMKPVKMWEYGIENHSRHGDIVLEPFSGSGTTFIACEETGRTCYGMELDPHYCSVIIKRCEDFSGKKAVKLS